MDLTEEDIIKRVLGEYHLPPERALAGLVRVLVDRHLERVETEVQVLGQPENPTEYESVSNLLNATLERNLRVYRVNAADGKESDPDVDDESFFDGVLAGQAAHTQRALVQILIDALALGERQLEQAREEARLMGEDQPDPFKLSPATHPPPPPIVPHPPNPPQPPSPHMRIVKD